MDTAISILEGGREISASDLGDDIELAAGLMLYCPSCRRPVYLRRGCTRSSKLGKLHEVPPAFCHEGLGSRQKAGISQEVLDIIQACELRSQTREGREEVARITAQRREWRARFGDHFAGMYLLAHGPRKSESPAVYRAILSGAVRELRTDGETFLTFEKEGFSFRSGKPAKGVRLNERDLEIMGSLHAYCRENFGLESCKYLNQYLDLFFARDWLTLGAAPDEGNKYLRRISSTDNHRQITLAVHDFLAGEANFELFASVLILELRHSLADNPEYIIKKAREPAGLWPAIMVRATVRLAITPWEYGWSQYQDMLRVREKRQARAKGGTGFA